MPAESVLLEQGSTPLLPLGSFPPAYKIAGAFCFAVCVSLLAGQGSALVACCCAVALALAGRLPLKALARRLVPVNFFFIFLWLFLPVDLSGGSPAFSRPGVELAALITLKGNAIAIMVLALLGTSPVSETCRGFLKLRLPEKFVTLLLLTYSNLSRMQDEYAKMSSAAKLRGFVPRNSLAGYKTIAHLAAMLLVRSWQRSQRVNIAMRLRGFSGRYPLLELRPPVPYNPHGAYLAGGVCLAGLALLLVDLAL